MPRLARFLAPLVGLFGLIDIVSALTPPERSRVHELNKLVPLGVSHAATAAVATLGVLLIMLSRGLRRRKRRAWIATTLVVAASVVLHVVKGLDVEEATGSLVLLGLLITAREDFRAEGDRRSRWRGLVVFVELVVADAVMGVLLIETAPDRVVAGHRTLSNTITTTFASMIGLDGPLHLRQRRGDVIFEILLALGAFTVVAALYLTLRAPRQVDQVTAEETEQLRGLLAKHGGQDSLGYFALRRDKSVVFSPSGKAAVTFRLVANCLLASGDPLGDPEAWPGAIAAYLDLCRRHGWIPAVVGCSEAGAEAWAKNGNFDALELGDEAIVYVSEFSLEGRHMRGVRQAVARVDRAGYEVTVRRIGDLSSADRERLRSQAAAWRGAETERGFSMALGRLGAPEDDACVVVTAELDGQLAAFLHFVPWGRDGLSLDLMRRDASCQNGINELLIVRALEAATSLGVERISLNFAVFRAALERGQRIGAGPVLRLWTAVLLFASRWFQIESLHRFNAKFQPDWQPRFVCYASARDLARISIAFLEAEAFIVRPGWLSPLRES